MAGDSFFDADEDEQLAATNAVFWDCVIEHVLADRPDPPTAILDIGCHHGGLLARLADLWKPRRAWGIEPLESARARTTARLHDRVPDVHVLDVVEWPRVPATGFDLITCHEVLYLVADLSAFMTNIHRALSRGGRAYVVLGCHAENPVWAHWKPLLAARGHQVHDHRPMDILAAGAAAGLSPALRPLRPSGWITHDPRHGEFTFPSASAMLDHHFKHKLLFRFTRP